VDIRQIVQLNLFALSLLRSGAALARATLDQLILAYLRRDECWTNGGVGTIHSQNLDRYRLAGFWGKKEEGLNVA